MHWDPGPLRWRVTKKVTKGAGVFKGLQKKETHYKGFTTFKDKPLPAIIIGPSPSLNGPPGSALNFKFISTLYVTYEI